MKKELDTAVLVLAISIVFVIPSASSAFGDPIMADPDNFDVELFFDFETVPDRQKPFFLLFADEEDGFPPGLYVTTPFTGDDKLWRLEGKSLDDLFVVIDDLSNPEGLILAQGEYGEGMFIAELTGFGISRVTPELTLEDFLLPDIPPFGPTQMAFTPEGILLAIDFFGNSLVMINPDGTSSVITAIPPPPTPLAGVAAAKSTPIVFTAASRTLYGADVLVGQFSITDATPDPLMDNSIFKIIGGEIVGTLVSGLSGLESMTIGPGGSFGDELYIAELGGDGNANGAVSIVTPEGIVIPFMSNIDAATVAFDTKGILGGGMFVSDFNDGLGSGKIWHVTATQPVGGELIPIETTSLILAGVQTFSWMIPVVLSGIGIGLFVVSRKSE